jgi:hypothetical protein
MFCGHLVIPDHLTRKSAITQSGEDYEISALE